MASNAVPVFPLVTKGAPSAKGNAKVNCMRTSFRFFLGLFYGPWIISWLSANGLTLVKGCVGEKDGRGKVWEKKAQLGQALQISQQKLGHFGEQVQARVASIDAMIFVHIGHEFKWDVGLDQFLIEDE